MTAALTRPTVAVSATRAIGRYSFVTACTPAVTVVTPTKHIGARVTSAHAAWRPLFKISVVPTASAMIASSWFATPNIGQIVAIDPVRMK